MSENSYCKKPLASVQEHLRDKQQTIYILLLFLLCFLFLWWRSSYGYIFNDEPYILTLGDRLIKGDLLLISEWRPAQLTGYLLYPFMIIYHFFHSSTTGIILFFRHLYVLLWSAVMVFSYQRLKKYAVHRWVAAAATLYIWLFASLDQMTLSYNFFSLAGIIVSAVLWMTYDDNFSLFWIGIFYSIAVVACPYLAVLYLIYIIAFISFHFCPSFRKKVTVNALKAKTFSLISLGILVSICLFVLFLFLQGGTIRAIFQSLNYILSDNEYPARPFWKLTLGYLKVFALDYKMFIYPSLIFISLSILDKKRQFQCFAVHTVWFFCSLIILLLYYPTRFNYIMVPVCLLGFQAMISSKNSNKNLIKLFWLGVIYSIVLFCSSNLQAIAVAMGLSISGFASFFLIDSYLINYPAVQNLNRHGNKYIYTILSVCVIQISAEFCHRYVYYYWDDCMWNLDARIENGPAAGIYSTSTHVQEYNDILNDIQQIPSGSKVLVLSMEPWIYLSDNTLYATYSSWISGDADYYLTRLNTYYSIHPDKKPDFIYILQSDYDPNIIYSKLFQENYSEIRTKTSIIFFKVNS